MESANRLSLRDYHRWAEPFADGVQRSGAEPGRAARNRRAVRVRPWPREWSPVAARLSIARLDVRGDTVELVATGSLARDSETHERSSRPGARSLGHVRRLGGGRHRAVLLELSGQIAAEVSRGARRG
jgi:hypothetical protein